MIKIPVQYDSLKFMRPISWAEIFEIWKKGEASQESWKQHWEERGFDSWDAWRSAYAAPLAPQNLKWFLFKLENPLLDVSKFYAVPSRGWIEKAYQGEKTKQFKDILQLPIIANNDKVAAIKQNFPSGTMLTGIIHEKKIVLYEGMHRASALATWPKGKPFSSEVSIALAVWENAEIPIVGGIQKQSNT